MLTRRLNRPPLWRDQKAIAIAVQAFTLALILLVGLWLWSNFQQRTAAIGLDLNFDFLRQPANIPIADNPISNDASISATLLQALKNTFLVILAGIPLSLLLGTLVGIARMSTNWLVRKFATGYVEIIRNLPPLLIIVFLWGGVFLAFPAVGEGAEAENPWSLFGGWMLFSNSRFGFPSVVGLDNFEVYRTVFVLSVVIAGAVWIWRTWVFNRTGKPHRRLLYSFATLLILSAVAFLVLQGPFEFSKPMLEGRVWSGGFRMQMPYVALMLALVLYTGSHISEIVRGSILAVHKGQVEASHALALNGLQRYRFVILPQAFRIAFPSLINQFLNYTKNSSLGVAIGFAEVTSVIFNLFGQSQPAPQLLLVLMFTYLALSLLLSAIGNLINRLLTLEGAA